MKIDKVIKWILVISFVFYPLITSLVLTAFAVANSSNPDKMASVFPIILMGTFFGGTKLAIYGVAGWSAFKFLRNMAKRVSH